MYTKQLVASAIDHSALKPFMTDRDIAAACDVAKRFGCASVCCRPSDVALVARELAGTRVATCTVIGFPHGSNRPEIKAAEARLAIADGARELDMVMNIGKFLSGDEDWVGRDIAAVVAEARSAGSVLVKVILEISYLNLDQVARACVRSQQAGADFVKTSTGFSDSGATRDAIDVMLKTVGNTMGVKASGGIRTWQSAVAFLKQGCRRLGIGNTEQVLAAAPL